MHPRGGLSMGWLRDLMQGSQPRYRSFGALARAALAHEAWPAHVHTQPRSLATVLSKLDRDTDVEWLADRTEVQRVLAELLGCTVADVQAAVVAGGTVADNATRRVRLDDVRYARALDLLEEPLPPGIPDAVRHPEIWQRVWWLAPSGSGRTLTGRWLSARGLARFAVAREWAELGDRAATAAPLYVELTGVAAPVRPLRARLCVAAGFRPPPNDGWTVVESPPLDDYLDELVQWVAERLESDTELDPERAAHWLRAEALARPELATLGVALGLCGLVDELGLRSLERQSLAQAGRRYVEVRLAEWRRNERGDTSGFERRGFDVLVGMVRQTLTDDDRPWSAPRHFDDWVAAVPPEHQRGADVDWLRLSLPRVDRTIRPSDVERAARSMPPGAFRIVRALRGARLLAPGRTEDELALSPRWLGAVAAAEAERSLAGASPIEWGEALLRPHAARGVARSVVERVAGGDTAVLDAVLELSDEDNPASVAALEAAFCAAGSALLDGQELPSELGDELWQEQARLWVELPGTPPRPRLLEGVLGAEWALAALVLSGGTEEPALDAIQGLWARESSARAGAIAALVDRARRTRGTEARHRLEQAGVLVDGAQAGSARYETVRALDDAERDVAALERISEERGIGLDAVAAAAFTAWDRAGRPELPPLFRAASLLRHVPAPLLGAVVERAHADGFELAWEALGEETRHALAESASPGVLWALFPETASARFDAALGAEELERAVTLLCSAPVAASPALVESFRERAALDRVSDRALTELRAWLCDRIGERGDGWREAYALLAEIERLIASSRLRA